MTSSQTISGQTKSFSAIASPAAIPAATARSTKPPHDGRQQHHDERGVAVLNGCVDGRPHVRDRVDTYVANAYEPQGAGDRRDADNRPDQHGKRLGNERKRDEEDGEGRRVDVGPVVQDRPVAGRRIRRDAVRDGARSAEVGVPEVEARVGACDRKHDGDERECDEHDDERGVDQAAKPRTVSLASAMRTSCTRIGAQGLRRRSSSRLPVEG